MNWQTEDRIKQVILALKRGEVSRTTAAADLRRILKASNYDCMRDEPEDELEDAD